VRCCTPCCAPVPACKGTHCWWWHRGWPAAAAARLQEPMRRQLLLYPVPFLVIGLFGSWVSRPLFGSNGAQTQTQRGEASVFNGFVGFRSSCYAWSVLQSLRQSPLGGVSRMCFVVLGCLLASDQHLSNAWCACGSLPRRTAYCLCCLVCAHAGCSVIVAASAVTVTVSVVMVRACSRACQLLA
jgi:hypothetical protein